MGGVEILALVSLIVAVIAIGFLLFLFIITISRRR